MNEYTDCEYTAVLGNSTLQLNCDPAKHYLLIDGEKFELYQHAAKMLCQLVCAQLMRRESEEMSAKLDDIKRVGTLILERYGKTG